jgi:predicted nucleic acid-binding protein
LRSNWRTQTHVRFIARHGGDLSALEGTGYSTSGYQQAAHDARLVAARQAHRLTAILTFDRSGFSRYSGIQVLHPAESAVGGEIRKS